MPGRRGGFPVRFRTRGAEEEPEINLIPFIDGLLVILIFLMLTTTYSKFTELQLTLPVADADAARERPREIVVAVAADGRYAVDKTPLAAATASTSRAASGALSTA